MLFKKTLNKKLSQAGEVLVEPAKKAVQDHVDAVKMAIGNRSDLGAKIFKLIIGAAMVFFTFKEEKQQNPPAGVNRSNATMPNIVINNYIKEDRNDHKYQRNTKPRTNGRRYDQNGGRVHTGNSR